MDTQPLSELEGPVRQTLVWRPIHYLGSKLRLVDAITELVDQLDPAHGPICDLFAGSGVVSAAFSHRRTVTAVDIQEYSRVLCSAVLQPVALSQASCGDILRAIHHSELRQALHWAVEPMIELEAEAIEDARLARYDTISDIIEFGSLVTLGKNSGVPSSPRMLASMRKTATRLKRVALAEGPRAVVLRHFGGVYFSYKQAVDLAAILEIAHGRAGQLSDVALAASLSTASGIVNTVGKQFAQPIRPRDVQGRPKAHLIRKIISDRCVDAIEVYSKWLVQYRQVTTASHANRALRADYTDALANECSDVSIIYADPPYTRDHYSRYYHVLETMCLHDDPPVAASNPTTAGMIGRGIYRTARHQSPFCIKSQAPNAFRRLFSGVRSLDVPLVLSYSPLAESTKPRPRVIEITDLIALARSYFLRVDLVPGGHIGHYKLNKAELNSEMSYSAELFLVCS